MSSTRWFSRLVKVGTLTLAAPLGAQSLDPPPGAASDAPPPAASDAPPAAASESAAAESTEWAETPASRGEEPSAAEETDPSADSAPVETLPPDERERSLSEAGSLLGATGLMRVLSAASGAPGTFRISLLTGFYSGTGFLCPQCPNDGQDGDVPDEVDRVAAHLLLSATLTDFLEVYTGIYSYSTSTNRPAPQLKQVVGDWLLGAKLFTPAEPGQIFSAGGAVDFGFSTGSGQVGLKGIDSINLGLRALGTADFSKLEDDPIPLRAHLNLSYYFDNSSKLVADYEAEQGENIDRIERFSLDINRVDFLQFGLGVEGMFDTARPFLEWSIDVPANRQSYTCQRDLAPPGDSCLSDRSGFATTPSRLTAGLRVTPWRAVDWWVDGLAFTGALDLGTGATSDFLVEVAPEAPWSLWFGLSYAADTQPRVKIQQIAAPVAAPAPHLSVHGVVLEKDTTNAIPEALIHFDGRNLTGLISTAEGRFVTGPLDPGPYTFRVAASGYKEGTCSVDVRSGAVPGTPAAPAAAAPTATRGLASSPASGESLPGVTPITCELEPVPKVSNLNGRVSDNTTSEPLGVASVRITDVLGRELELQVDEVGAFRFENVPPGSAVITIQAPGYLKSVTRFDVEPLQELDQRFPLMPVPSKSNVRIAGKQLELATPIAFPDGSAKLSREALFAVQELAPFIEAHPEIGRIEIQGHTADASPSAMTLSTDRANAVRDALVLHGVAAGRLTARGFGGGDPLVTTDSEVSRRKNERITFKLEPATATGGILGPPPGAPAKH
jgi:outer membrane protein OmpA-like peptidoglycan-associated protein